MGAPPESTMMRDARTLTSSLRCRRRQWNQVLQYCKLTMCVSTCGGIKKSCLPPALGQVIFSFRWHCALFARFGFANRKRSLSSRHESLIILNFSIGFSQENQTERVFHDERTRKQECTRKKYAAKSIFASVPIPLRMWRIHLQSKFSRNTSQIEYQQ